MQSPPLGLSRRQSSRRISLLDNNSSLKLIEEKNDKDGIIGDNAFKNEEIDATQKFLVRRNSFLNHRTSDPLVMRGLSEAEIKIRKKTL
jgi:hypothetical protein